MTGSATRCGDAAFPKLFCDFCLLLLLLLEGASPNISWIVPAHSTSDDSAYSDYDFDDEDNNNNNNNNSFDDEDDDDDTENGDDDNAWTWDDTEALSCIGVRRLCLRDASCRSVLRQFRQFCVENTRIHQCVTTQWFVTSYHGVPGEFWMERELMSFIRATYWAHSMGP